MEIRKGLDIRDAGAAHLRVSRRKRFGDLLTYHFRGSLILRTAALAHLADLGLRFTPEVYRWPLCLVDTATGEPFAEYTILLPLRSYDVIDWTRADAEFFPGSDDVMEMKRWAIDDSELPDADAIPVELGAWICNEAFRRAVEASHLTGIAFTAV